MATTPFATLLALALSAAAAGCVAAPAPDVRPTAAPAPRPADFTVPLAPGEMALEPVPDGAWLDLAVAIERPAELLASIDESLAWLAKPASRRYYPYLDIDHERVRASLGAFRDLVAAAPAPAALEAELRRRFVLYRSKGRARTGEVLFTSYCEPIYPARLAPDAEFRWPLYRRPPDLVSDAEARPLGWRRPDGTVGPSPARREIDDGGALRGRGLELVWLRDPLEAYLVHVQGSARLRLPDGRLFPVGYAGKTEHPYASLGRALIRDGKVPADEMSLAAIRRYFAAHPGETARYLAENPSYVFFAATEPGPFGSLGVKVTPRASIATDKDVFPRGALAFVDARLGGAPFRAFVLDQDTGGAIRTAGRCDIFAGTGPEAEAVAGATLSVGRLYYLFLRPGGGG